MTDYLAQYDQTDPQQQYPLVAHWMKTEPLPFFKQLRAQRPILVTPQCTLLALFTDIRDALQMPRIFTVDLYKSKMGVTADDPGYLMAHDDDALHYREKSLMQGLLNRDDLPRVRQQVTHFAKRILDQAHGNIEIVNAYCRIVPALLVQQYFGLDGIPLKDLIRWSFWNQYDAFHNQPFDLHSPEQSQHISDEHAKVTQELVTYIKALMIRKVVAVNTVDKLSLPWRLLRFVLGRSIRRQDDIVSRMIRSSFATEVDFSLLRVGVNAGGLLIGAVETTSQAVAQTLQFFIERPQLLAQAKTAATLNDPTDFDNMVWEALRYVPISPYLFRQLAVDYTLAKGTERQTSLQAGSNILMLTQSAMFDDYAFAEPEQFNPKRNGYHHFNFGFGSHECLGKYIGMVMIPEMVRQVVLRNPLRATSSMDYQQGPFPEQYQLAWH